MVGSERRSNRLQLAIVANWWSLKLHGSDSELPCLAQARSISCVTITGHFAVHHKDHDTFGIEATQYTEKAAKLKNESSVTLASMVLQ